MARNVVLDRRMFTGLWFWDCFVSYSIKQQQINVLVFDSMISCMIEEVVITFYKELGFD